MLLDEEVQNKHQDDEDHREDLVGDAELGLLVEAVSSLFSDAAFDFLNKVRGCFDSGEAVHEGEGLSQRFKLLSDFG